MDDSGDSILDEEDILKTNICFYTLTMSKRKKNVWQQFHLQ
jgi:hypothetical protein